MRGGGREEGPKSNGGNEYLEVMTRKNTRKDGQYRKGRYLIRLKHGHGARWWEGGRSVE